MKSLLCTLLALPMVALAQASPPQEFPADSAALDSDALRERISGRVFHVQPHSGPSWRLEYRGDGYAFVDTSTGNRDKGQWRVEDGKLCVEWNRGASTCSEGRATVQALYFKRASGEVVVFNLR